jgi:dTDP-glucose pyrophosphorylase
MIPSSPKRADRLKALILAGGRGKRLRELEDEKNKCLISYHGRPLIDYSLENAAKIGVDEIVIVVGHLAEQLINVFGISYQGIRIRYVIQREQLGVVHAISCAQSALEGADFLLLLGDEFFCQPDHSSLLRYFDAENAFIVCGVIQVEDLTVIRKTYSILFDKESRRILRLIEKPQNPSNAFMGTGNIIFKNEIMEFIDKTPINPQRGERELPDLIQCAIDDGRKVLFHVFASLYVNVNTPEDATVLDTLSRG